MTRKQITETEALDEIHALMDGCKWGTDTLETIADILLTCGRPVRDCNYEEDES